MKTWFGLQTAAFGFWMDVLAAQRDAARTVAARGAILLDTSTAAKRRRAERESRTMVAEKVAALALGAAAGARVLMRTSLSTGSDPVAVSKAMLRASRAAFEPARVRVAANARRLSRTRSKT